MSTQQPTIIYTLTDEAPRLATASFLPLIRTFTAPAGINVVESDISVAARVLGEFSDFFTEDQKVPNTLAELGKKDASSGRQHHQAAQHQCFCRPVGGLYQRAAEQGLRDSLTILKTPKTDEEKAIRVALLQVHR